LLSAVELGVSPDSARARAAAEEVLRWLFDPARTATLVAGRYRPHASQDGNALFVCCRLRLRDDPRVQELAERLQLWQWPDGGWNCDPRPAARHSSFYETLGTLRGLAEHGGFPEAVSAAAEFLLKHRLYRSHRSTRVIDGEWLRLHWPTYWHYDILQALRVLARLGLVNDRRAQDAVNHLLSLRQSDGSWRANGRRYWHLAGQSNVEVVDWGNASALLTRQAEEVLGAAGVLSSSRPTSGRRPGPSSSSDR
jgi:hypothetical protein